MTWLGKILTFLVLIAAVATMWFVATVYVTRTNWKNQADMYKTALAEAHKAREAEYKVYMAENDALRRQIATEQEKSSGLGDRIARLEGANKEVVTRVETLATDFNKEDVKATEIQANYQAAVDELNRVRARSHQLEDDRKDLVIAVANANTARQAAENLARQEAAARLLADRKIEDLTGLLAEARSTGGGGGGGSVLPPGSRPAPVPEGLRGTVTAVSDDKGYVVISVGLDAGLTQGAVLDIYRQDGADGTYLGTLVIDKVQPKQAGAVFKPADAQRTIKQLRLDQLPKVNDLVGHVRTTAVNR